jgi:ribosomal protein L37E
LEYFYQKIILIRIGIGIYEVGDMAKALGESKEEAEKSKLWLRCRRCGRRTEYRGEDSICCPYCGLVYTERALNRPNSSRYAGHLRRLWEENPKEGGSLFSQGVLLQRMLREKGLLDNGCRGPSRETMSYRYFSNSFFLFISRTVPS